MNNFVLHLCVVGTHGSITSERASWVAVTGVWKGVIFYFVVPGLYQLQNGPISVSKIQTK